MSMGLDEFRTLLDAWGADAGRWPRERQADAQALLASREEARLLLADEVGLGKTLSLGTAALTLCLLADREQQVRRPVVIFAPAR